MENRDNPNKKFKMLNLFHFLDRTTRVEGDVIELGSKVGESAIAMRFSTNKTLHVFDSFELGFPQRSSEDGSHIPSKVFESDIYKQPQEVLLSNFDKAGAERPIVHAGWLSDTLDQLPEKIAFAYIDVDLYESTLESLEAVYPRLSPGAIVLIDDCIFPGANLVQMKIRKKDLFPGVYLATAEFMQGKEPIQPVFAGAEGQVYFEKWISASSS